MDGHIDMTVTQRILDLLCEKPLIAAKLHKTAFFEPRTPISGGFYGNDLDFSLSSQFAMSSHKFFPDFRRLYEGEGTAPGAEPESFFHS